MSYLARRLSHHGVLLFALLAVAAGLTAGPLAPSAHASTYTPSLSRFDQRLLADINHARAARGIRRLVVVAGTTDVAHGWSCHLATKLTLGHNYGLGSALSTHGSANWTTYGENVGMTSR